MVAGVICSKVIPLSSAIPFSSSTMSAMSVWSGIAFVRRKRSATRIFAPAFACSVRARAESIASFVSAICLSSDAALECWGPIRMK